MQPSAINLIRSVFGHPCWQVRWDGQVGLDMDFGTPRLEIREPAERRPAGELGYNRSYMRRAWLFGTHALAITPRSWRLEIADGTVARDTSRAKLASMAVARLRGEKLDGLTIDGRSGATTLYFDLGARIVVRTARDHSEGIELASFSDSSRVVQICPRGFYRFGSVHTTLRASHDRPVTTQAGGVLVLARTVNIARLLRQDSV